MRALLIAMLLVGCNRGGATPPEGTAEPDQAPDVEAPATPADPGPDASPPTPTPDAGQGEPVQGIDGGVVAEPPLDARALYAECEARLEQPESAGECTSDADCVRSGCSSEICTTAKAAADLMTTCEVLPCFSAVDTCGCSAGVCRWTLKDEVVLPLRKIDLPQ